MKPPGLCADPPPPKAGTEPREFDLAIIGGGLAGASLAAALGPSGRRIAVVEPYAPGDAAQPSFDERAVALTFASRTVFETLGVWRRVGAAACPIESIHVSERGGFGAARLRAADAGTRWLGFVVAARVLGAALDETIAAYDNVAMLRPDGAESACSARRAVLVATASGERLSAPLAVLADGGRSARGAELGLALETRDYAQEALVTVVETDRGHRDRAYERFTEHGPLALLPFGERRFAVAWTLPAARARAAVDCDAREFLDALQDAFGDRCGRMVRVGGRRAHALAFGYLASNAARRAVAIGNAAHVVHPVAGQGFNLALRDVAELADYLGACWAAGHDPGFPERLAAYDRRRRAQTRRVGAFTDGMVRLFTASTPGLGAARNAGLSLVDALPPVKRSLLRRTIGLKGRLPRLARGLPVGFEAAPR